MRKQKRTGNTSQDAELSVLQHIADLVSIVDKDYRYRAVSKGYELFFGCQHSEIVGREVAEIHGEAVFSEHIRPGLERTLQGEELHLRFWRPNAAGEMRFLDCKQTPYHGPLTEGAGVAVVVRDVTDLMQAKEHAEHEEALLNTIIDAIPDFIFAKDYQGRYQVCNKSFAEFLGLENSEIIGRDDFQLMSENSARYIQEKDQQIRQSLEAQRFDEWVKYSDGRQRLLDMYKLPLVDSLDSPAGVLGIGRNVTYERQAEQNLLMASLVFDTTTDPCLIFDANGQLVSSNQAAKKRFDIISSKPAGLSINELFYCPVDHELDIASKMAETTNWFGEMCSLQGNQTMLATVTRVQGQSEQLNKFVIIIRDENTHNEVTENLLHIAYQDALTNLPNRRLFYSRLESAIIRAERQLSQLAVLYIDLDNFKPVNDRYGHGVGDQVLIQIAERLKLCFRSTDTLARIGGDEFVALVDIEDKQHVIPVAHKILHSLEPPVQLNENDQAIISASIGISIFPEDAGTADELLHSADKAMYKAKRASGDYFHFSDD